MGYSGTIRSTRAVSVLRHFREVLGDTLYAWDMFAGTEPECFVCEYPTVNETWSTYISQINDSVAHLRFLERSLAQKIQLFDRMKDNVGTGRVLCIGMLTPAADERICPQREPGGNESRR